jgi:hypothetical protein
MLDMHQGPVAQAIMSAPQKVSYRTIGICHLAENPSEPGNATNMLSPVTEVEIYFHNHHWELPEAVTAKVVRPPAHGTLTPDYPDSPNVLVYHPHPGYLGKDRVTVIASIGEKPLRIEYFVNVMTVVQADDQEPGVYERGDCPVNARVWDIKTVPARRHK